MEQKRIEMRLSPQYLKRLKITSIYHYRWLKIWIYHHDPESKEEAIQWVEIGSLAPKRSKEIYGICCFGTLEGKNYVIAVLHLQLLKKGYVSVFSIWKTQVSAAQQ